MASVVYRVYNADGALLYIGSTANLAVRLEQHRSPSNWWHVVDRIETEAFPALAAARAAETRAIHDEMPRWNVIGRNPAHPDGPAWVDDVYDIWPGDFAEPPPWLRPGVRGRPRRAQAPHRPPRLPPSPPRPLVQDARPSRRRRKAMTAIRIGLADLDKWFNNLPDAREEAS